jgi:branched-chain amino acid:cation transporter, LIVCS family
MKKSHILSYSLALFAMMFGAGNVAFPIVLGQFAGKQVFWGLLGFFLSSVIIPFIGFITIMLFDGKYENFLEKIGKISQTLVIITSMILMGPFMGIPRAITLSHASLKLYAPISLLLYSILATLFVFACATQRTRLANIFGHYFGPIKFILLFALAAKGLYSAEELFNTGVSKLEAFSAGIFNGYCTGDLIGVIFFSCLIFLSIKKDLGKDCSSKQLALAGVKIGSLGIGFLGIVYTGFSYMAAFHADKLVGLERGDLYSILSKVVLGSEGGFLSNAAMIVACLVTAITLLTIFSVYIHEHILVKKIPYIYVLIINSVISVLISLKGFDAIMFFGGISFSLIYPPLIALALANFSNKMFGTKWIKTPFYITLVIGFLIQYGSMLKNFTTFYEFMKKIGIDAWI